MQIVLHCQKLNLVQQRVKAHFDKRELFTDLRSMLPSFRNQAIPADIYLLNGNTRARCEICSRLTIKRPERCHGVFIVNFEHMSHLF